ncbi:MAG: hypothetical protein AAF694_13325 [Bacteroidota bacterium]
MDNIDTLQKYKLLKALVDEPRSLECLSWIAGTSMINAIKVLDELVEEGKAEREGEGYLLPREERDSSALDIE